MKIAKGIVENTCSNWNELGVSTPPLFPHAFLTTHPNRSRYLSFINDYLRDEILRIDEFALGNQIMPRELNELLSVFITFFQSNTL